MSVQRYCIAKNPLSDVVSCLSANYDGQDITDEFGSTLTLADVIYQHILSSMCCKTAIETT